jgi:hypothetical protein
MSELNVKPASCCRLVLPVDTPRDTCERCGDVSPLPALSGILHKSFARQGVKNALGQPFGSVGLFLEISDGHRCTLRAQVEANAFVASVILASLTVCEISHCPDAASGRGDLAPDDTLPVLAGIRGIRPPAESKRTTSLNLYTFGQYLSLSFNGRGHTDGCNCKDTCPKSSQF